MLSFALPHSGQFAKHSKAKAEEASRQDRRAIVNSKISGPCECGAEKTMLLLPCAHQKMCCMCDVPWTSTRARIARLWPS